MKLNDYGPGILINDKNFAWPNHKAEYANYVKNLRDAGEYYVCATLHGYILDGTSSTCVKGKVVKNIKFPAIFIKNSFKNYENE